MAGGRRPPAGFPVPEESRPTASKHGVMQHASTAANSRPQDVKKLKISICGPTWMHLRHGPENTYDTSVYDTDGTSETSGAWVIFIDSRASDAYFADLIHAYREELRALYAAGCRNIQFDDPTFAFFCADSTIEGMKKAGVDWEKLYDTYIRVYNDILKGRPADMTVGLHTCRGNYKVYAIVVFWTP